MKNPKKYRSAQKSCVENTAKALYCHYRIVIICFCFLSCIIYVPGVGFAMLKFVLGALARYNIRPCMSINAMSDPAVTP